MMRCPHCGRRVPDAAPSCSEHGVVTSAAAISSEAYALDPSVSLAARGYRVTGLLGRGGFGAVFAAERTSDRTAVAIKLAHPDAAVRLQREETALRRIGAPHVPKVFEAGEIEEGFYIAMELVQAPTLAARMLELAGPAPLAKFGALARAILSPLGVVHAHDYVHCDLTPENIFIEDSGRARLIDFGLARQLRALLPADDVGTAEYMSPEQCDRLLCDRSADIYSLGIVFYELLSGAPPFWGPASIVREAHRSQRLQPVARPGAYPAALDQVLRRCLAKRREQRFQDVPSLRQALEQALRSPLMATASLRPSRGATPTSREQRAMGLVFFESDKDVARVQAVVASSRGQIVHTHGLRYVAAFGHEAGANPARVALQAAQRLLADDVTQRALVDVSTVSVRTRSDGSRRIFSNLLTRSSRYPSADDPEAISCTRAAAEVLPELEFRSQPGAADRLTLVAAAPSADERPALIGRDEILCKLISGAERAAQLSEPALTTVLSPPGYGRTHLAAAVAHALRGFEVIALSAQEGALSQVLPKLLRRVLDLPEARPDEPRSFLVPLLGAAAEATWPGVAYALGWIGVEHPELRRLAAAPGTLRLTAARAAAEALLRMAADRQVALLLDDAHLADEATLDALQFATSGHAPGRLWICVLAPLGFASIRPSWFTPGATAQHIVLAELAPKHATQLARQLLLPAEYIPDAVLQKLAERTQGVPRLLVELARGLKRDGFVRKAARGTGYYLATDELDKLSDLPIVHWNALREVEALPPQLAGYARLASILDTSFSVTEVDALIAQLEHAQLALDIQLDPSVGLQRLVNSGILVRHPSGLLDFRNAVSRDMIYRLVPETQRARFHRAAFEAYNTLALPEDVRLPRLAKHAARCGEREVAAVAYLDLARHHAHAQAYLDAEAAYGGAFDNLPADDERTVEAARGRGLMRARVGRHDAALKDLRQARQLAQQHGLVDTELAIMLDEATMLDWLRESQAAIALVRAVAAAEVPLSPLLQARLAMSVARSHFRQGEIEACIQAGERAVQLSAALGDDGYETRALAQLMVAPSYAICGKIAEAQRSFEQLLLEAESRGDLRHVAALLGNRAHVWHALRDTERLFADLERAAQLGRELGEAPLEYTSVFNLAESELVLGRLGPAREHAQRMIELTQQQFGDNNFEVSCSEILLARIALYEDDFETVKRLRQNVRARIERGRALADPDAALEPATLLLFEMVELSVSVAPLQAWQSLLERSRSQELQLMEKVEIMERAALSAAERGEWPFGRGLYEELVLLLKDNPSLITDRVLRKLEPIFGEPS